MERKRYNSQFKFYRASVNSKYFHNNNAMGLFKSLIGILIVGILFLQTSNLYTNGEVSVPVINHIRPVHIRIPIRIPISKSMCSRIVSHDLSDYVPYIEKYNLLTRAERLNYNEKNFILKTTEPECCKGFTQIDTYCVPHCPQSCRKGYCLEPDVCTCHIGYRESNDTNDKETCVPMCMNGCINGTCIEPDICGCNKDYWLDSDGFTCRPICNEECEYNYGYCNEPNVCSCRPGYTKVGNTCEPVCNPKCIKSFCVAPNVCKCLDGHEMQSDRFTCVPKCNETCVFSKCIAPQMCYCNSGYAPVNASVCEPICSEPCRMGTCIAPETCKCNDGYGYRNESAKHICDPICEKCNNGTCVAPGVCVCDKGFVYDNQTDPVCKPYCTIPCGPNGKCTMPETCTCSEGYRKNGNFCEPICERGCQNGNCLSPNYCVCHDHFVPNFGSSFEAECIPECSRNCSGHGACIIEGNEYRCKCHYGWTGWDCDQPTICIITMDFNSSDINRIMIRNDTNNSTITQAYENAPHCYQCDNSLNKESLCYMIPSDKGNTTPIISCLLSTDLPCYLVSHYSASVNVAKIVWPFVVIATLIAIILITYLIYRRYEKKKLFIGMPTKLFVRESFGTESLLPDNVMDL